jgi:hypothetical protein
MSRRAYSTPLLVSMLALVACPGDDSPIDTEGTTGTTADDTTGLVPTTIDPDSTTTDDPDTTTGGPVCDPACGANQCCVGGACFGAPAPSCAGGCGTFEVCACPEGSDPCNCVGECSQCGTAAGGNDPCLDMPCPDGSVCVTDSPIAPTYGWCAQTGCGTDDCACPLPVGNATATPACGAFTGDEGNGSCFLDCSSGSCPGDMVCRSLAGESVCVWPGEGFQSDCCFAHATSGCDDMQCQDTVCAVDPFCCAKEWDGICVGQVPDLCPGLCPEPPPVPEPGYGNCGLPAGECAAVEQCISDGAMPTWAVCSQSGCANAADCTSIAPATGTAPVACADPSGMGGPNTCYLDCSAGQDCPDGMSCIADSWCAWPQGPVVFADDFETNDFSAGWTLQNVDGLTPDPNVGVVNQAWITFEVYEAGSYEAVSTSWYAPAGMSNDWLISPQIMLGDNTRLYWVSGSIDAMYPDNLEVRISTATNSVADLLVDPPVFMATPEVATPTFRFVDLAPLGYMNQPVYIAFRNYTFDGTLLTVDDVAVVDLP